jgi:hypothetical protein
MLPRLRFVIAAIMIAMAPMVIFSTAPFLTPSGSDAPRPPSSLGTADTREAQQLQVLAYGRRADELTRLREMAAVPLTNWVTAPTGKEPEAIVASPTPGPQAAITVPPAATIAPPAVTAIPPTIAPPAEAPTPPVATTAPPAAATPPPADTNLQATTTTPPVATTLPQVAIPPVATTLPHVATPNPNAEPPPAPGQQVLAALPEAQPSAPPQVAPPVAVTNQETAPEPSAPVARDENRSKAEPEAPQVNVAALADESTASIGPVVLDRLPPVFMPPLPKPRPKARAVRRAAVAPATTPAPADQNPFGGFFNGITPAAQTAPAPASR